MSFTNLSEPAYDAQQANAEPPEPTLAQRVLAADDAELRMMNLPALIMDLRSAGSTDPDTIEAMEVCVRLLQKIQAGPDRTYAERHDTEHDEPGPRMMDKLLAAGWHVQGASYIIKPCFEPVIDNGVRGYRRECRVVLVNKAVGSKLMGFGATFEEAFDSAASQV